MVNLQEVFHFYTHRKPKHTSDFDQLADKQSRMDLGDFSRLFIDFGIALPRMKVVDIYNRMSVNHEPLEFQQFHTQIHIVGMEYLTLLVDEQKYRLEELQALAEKLQLPLTYENKYKTKEYQTKALDYLNRKLEEYNRYVTNRLRQMCRLTDSLKPHQEVLNKKQKSAPKIPYPKFKLETDEMEVMARMQAEEDNYQADLEELKRKEKEEKKKIEK